MADGGTRPALRRREALAVALAVPLLTAGCTKGFGALGTPPGPGPDVAVLTSAIGEEQLMVARYQRVMTALPTLTHELAPILAQHRAHLRALQVRLVPGAVRPVPSRTATPPAQVPSTAPAATAYLGAAEATAASGLLGHLPARNPPLAQLLTSIAASEASHAAALGVKVSGGLPAAGGRRPAGPAVTAALQTALAAEHAAIYGYGVAGARLGGSSQAAALRDWNLHQAARDSLAALLTARGVTPVGTAAAYALPFPVRSARAAAALAALLEDRVATAYLGLVALPGRQLRLLGARSVEDAALRAAAWRHTTVPFPGLTARDGLAARDVRP